LDPIIIGGVVLVFLYLAGQNKATPAAAGTTATSTNPLSQALSGLASALSPAKSAGGGSSGGSSGGGSAGNMGSSTGSSASSLPSASLSNTVDGLATDGSAADAQEAAYLAALNAGNAPLANAILNNGPPIDTMSDPDPYADTLAPTSLGTYTSPTMDYSPTDTFNAIAGNGSDYGDDSGDDSGDDTGDSGD
jgi:hypothetical protein